MATPAVQRAPDTRNLAWVQDNVGAKLLSKMGWQQGEAVGRRSRTAGDQKTRMITRTTTTTTTTTTILSTVSSEGLRVVKRQDGLGLGASHILHTQSTHTQDFGALLQQLNREHSSCSTSSNNSTTSRRVSSKANKKQTVRLPTNKTTHHKVRQAKFQKKSTQDLACIFAGPVEFPVVAATEGKAEEGKKKKDKKKNQKKKKDQRTEKTTNNEE